MKNVITWDEETPVAVHFDDPYFSKRDGQAETRHVFIEGNHLPGRFSKAQKFHIGELGFGTGLNVLETLNTWHAIASDEAQLTFTSFELYPLTPEDIRRALSPWPDLLKFGKPILSRLPQTPGWHTIQQGNIALRLGIGDANKLIHDLEDPVDAWFFDGFSPAKNPELWNEGLMRAIAERTSANGTFATYTAAGWVRRMIEEAGFQVERCKGFGTKRHMSRGFINRQMAVRNTENRQAGDYPENQCEPH